MAHARTSNDSTDVTPAPSHGAQELAKLLGKSTLCERLNISPRTIENMVKDGTFPPPVRVGKFVYWSETAIHAWQRRLFAAQEAWTGH